MGQSKRPISAEGKKKKRISGVLTINLEESYYPTYPILQRKISVSI
jgi:hypothetical protein